MFVPLKKIIPSSSKKLWIEKRIKANQICDLYDKINKSNNGQTKTLFFKNKTLFVKVVNSILSQELQLKQEEIKKYINKKIGEEVIKKIKFLIQ